MGITSYAQNFEDVILWRVLGDIPGGFYVDVGAHDPIADSVSKAFYERGWRGVHIEPQDEFVQRLRQDRPEDQVLQAIVSDVPGQVTFYEVPDGKGLSTASSEIAATHARLRGYEVKETAVTAVTLDDVLKLAANGIVHWLKIDVEGFEAQVLKGWHSACRPWVLVIEATNPLEQTSSHEEWEPLILEKGYSVVYQDGLNRFYLHESQSGRAPQFRYPPNVHDAFDLRGAAWMTKGVRAELNNAASIANALLRELNNTRQYAEQLRVDLENHRRISDALISHLDIVQTDPEPSRNTEIPTGRVMDDIEDRITRYVNDNIYRVISELHDVEARVEKKQKEMDAVLEKVVRVLQELDRNFDARVGANISNRIYLPNLEVMKYADHGKFMAYSTCSASDFFHPKYAEICAMLRSRPVFHRKDWEWVYIIHKLLSSGVVGEGRRGIVFGVGQEKLPALFASLGASIVATDAPPDHKSAGGWERSNQYGASRDQLRHEGILPNHLFDQRVTHQFCDMNAIDPSLKDFDFTWSSCCFEHLGSLEAGIQFVINSVENVLKIGGIACHTTEFNLTSDDDTMTEGDTVIYRRRDMLEMVERLRERGHEVEPFIIAPDSHYMDYHVDVKPWTFNPHLKLRLGKYVATSVGIVVKRGK